MRVNDLGPERVDRAEADVRADPRKRREPLRIVGPVESVRPEIRIAGPVVEMRRVDREQVETGSVAGQDPRRAAEQIVVDMRRLRVGQLGQYRRVGRDESANLDAFAGESGGQGADDIGKPPGFDEREDLRGDGENLQLAHCASLSIIGLVINVTPLSVRRNRFGVKLRVLADHEAVGNTHFAVDDGFGKPHVAPDVDVRQHHRLVDGGVRMNAHAGEDERTAERGARDDAASRQAAMTRRCRVGRRRRGRISPAA